MKKQIKKEIDSVEIQKERREEAQRLAEEKEAKLRKRAPIVPVIAELADDDVAGDFFDEEVGEFNPIIEVHKDVGINSKKVSVKKSKPSAAMPGRKSGFKGVNKASHASVLDAAF